MRRAALEQLPVFGPGDEQQGDQSAAQEARRHRHHAAVEHLPDDRADSRCQQGAGELLEARRGARHATERLHRDRSEIGSGKADHRHVGGDQDEKH